VVVTAPGDHTLQYRATDNAGNTSPVQSASFTVAAPPDTTPPTVTAQVSGDGTAQVTVTLSATDDESGVDTIEYNLDGAGWTEYTAPVVVTAPVDHTLQYRATDNA